MSLVRMYLNLSLIDNRIISRARIVLWDLARKKWKQVVVRSSHIIWLNYWIRTHAF